MPAELLQTEIPGQLRIYVSFVHFTRARARAPRVKSGLSLSLFLLFFSLFPVVGSRLMINA